MRNAVRALGKDASDGRVTARLTQIMAQIKNMDEANARGERSVAEGLLKAEAKLLLKGFNFNANAVLGAVLHKPVQMDTATGEISIAALSPQNDISIPSGATHVIFKSGFASVNFETGESEMVVSGSVRLAADVVAQVLSLKPLTVPELDGIHFLLLSIDFVQAVNNVDYSLNNNSYNALAIVEVL